MRSSNGNRLRYVAVLALGFAATAGGDEPERRAVSYLSGEVARWGREEKCGSCHHGGEGARALYRARRAGLAVGPGPEALADAARWLARPGSWGEGTPGGPVVDRRLARVSFASALVEAVAAGTPFGPDVLKVAVARVAADQAGDGSWPVEDGGSVGSPGTYGSRLATAEAVRALRAMDPVGRAGAIRRGEDWLRSRSVENVVEAAALLRVEPTGAPTEAGRRALELLLKAQARGGAWGPYPGAPAEPFDTALALLALSPFRAEPGVSEALSRGRSALVALQEPDGSWPGTTRPAGGESLAQRVSTAGWATLALIAAREPSPHP